MIQVLCVSGAVYDLSAVRDVSVCAVALLGVVWGGGWGDTPLINRAPVSQDECFLAT